MPGTASEIEDAADRAPGPRTVGVEEEFLLVDPVTGSPVPLAAAVVAAAGPSPLGDLGTADHRPGFAWLGVELQQQMIEVATPPRTRLADLHGDLRRLRRGADDAARTVGARLAALATSPVPVTPRLSPAPRYEAIRRAIGATCDDQLTCGCHVHVGVSSDEEGVGVLDRLRPWLPVLAALATNSPFWDGRDTGYASYRAQAWSRWPGSGPTDVFGSASAYRHLVEQLITTGTLLDEAMVYFDARLSARYPTVEVRVADVCLDVADTVLVAALARALVDTAAQEWRAGVPPADDPSQLLRAASWRSSRSGADGSLVHPRRPELRPAAEVLRALVEHVRPSLEVSGDLLDVERSIDRVLTRGTGARVQREVAARHGDVRDVVAYAVEHTCDGAPLEASLDVGRGRPPSASARPV